MAAELSLGGRFGSSDLMWLVSRSLFWIILVVKTARLFVIGLCMGIADLIPGISGGTVAFICGIYEELLASIQTLKFQSLKKIAWLFLLPLGIGISTAILLLAPIFYFLLTHYKGALYAVFFGIIGASVVSWSQEADIKRPHHFSLLLLSGALSFWLSGVSPQFVFGTGFFPLILAGMLGIGAMLLPGISGSFLLQVFGVYPVVIAALATPTSFESLRILSAMGIGIAFGFIVFSRMISFLLSKFRSLMLSLLVGFMAGGLRALWPFFGQEITIPILLMATSFACALFIELKVCRTYKTG